MICDGVLYNRSIWWDDGFHTYSHVAEKLSAGPMNPYTWVRDVWQLYCDEGDVTSRLDQFVVRAVMSHSDAHNHKMMIYKQDGLNTGLKVACTEHRTTDAHRPHTWTHTNILRSLLLTIYGLTQTE